ncbi:MAG: PadR family transcriptional regulator [Acidimicrobiales bacterium]
MARRISETAHLLLTALAEGENHGYALARRVSEITSAELKLGSGTLYSTLDRLLADGLIEEAGEETVDGRARRKYRITRRGTAEIVQHVQRLSQRVEAMNTALGLT